VGSRHDGGKSSRSSQLGISARSLCISAEVSLPNSPLRQLVLKLPALSSRNGSGYEMFEYDASIALRVEIIEASITALFDTLPTGHTARVRFAELLQIKLDNVGFAVDRRHQLERMIDRISRSSEVTTEDQK
jgi:hypothetical protein